MKKNAGKLVIHKLSEPEERGCVVRIDKNANSIIEELAKMTGRSRAYLASKMIEFAFEHIEIKGDEDDEADDA